jgi:hypothetical protein
MRCAEVIRELAVPTDDRDLAALAEHLTSCSSCATWAKHAAQLDRLWKTTQPADPSPEIWENVWTKVAASLDSSRPRERQAIALSPASSSRPTVNFERPFAPAKPRPRSRTWSLAAIGLLALAQAAGILIALTLTWRPSTRSGLPQIVDQDNSATRPALAPTGVDIEEGRLVVIRVDGPAARVVDLTPEGISWSVDEWLLMLNEVESIPSSVVAMQE